MKRILEELNITIKSLIDTKNKNRLFNYIWKNYYKSVLLYVKSRFQFDDAEDTAQEIMIKIYSNFHLYSFDFSFRAWLYTTARNFCIDKLRKPKLSITGDYAEKINNDNLAGNKSAFDEIVNNELCRKIDAILTNEKPEMREIYFLYYHAGLTTREISKMTETPQGSVKFKLYDFRRKIKSELEDYYE